ncbi:DMT family transporter [Acinetobacter sp. MD2(2019)]|uniref:DMT family transporter n=1 Tax=Acinetobacter sp. MD2(2019) TaxID=2605273 RepID=UPI002D1EC7A4|nr:DMT family transporter [Acinetobacter sp. MD2(2019)]MEB3754134.1 DMT family transporter [Acinetobacter sp. MD2(2019)]
MLKQLISSNSLYITYIKLAVVAAIWGGTFVAGRSISADIPPLLASSSRFLIASLSLTAFLALFGSGFKRINFSQALTLLGLGCCGIYIYNLCFFYGLQYISASRASLIVASNPAIMAICSFIFYREKISRFKMLGIGLCLIGASVVIMSKNSNSSITAPHHWLGDGLIFGCVLSWVCYSLLSKKIVAEIGSLHTVTYSIYIGTALLLIDAGLNGQINLMVLSTISLQTLSSLIYLGAIGSALAYIWYYDAIQSIGSTQAGTFIALNPLTAVLLGALLLNESISHSSIVGGMCIIFGIIITNQSLKSKN